MSSIGRGEEGEGCKEEGGEKLKKESVGGEKARSAISPEQLVSFFGLLLLPTTSNEEKLLLFLLLSSVSKAMLLVSSRTMISPRIGSLPASLQHFLCELNLFLLLLPSTSTLES